jgi:hypothetical protein
MKKIGGGVIALTIHWPRRKPIFTVSDYLIIFMAIISHRINPKSKDIILKVLAVSKFTNA